MSVSYKGVGWNAFKKKYDQLLVGVIVLYLVAFVGVTLAMHPSTTPEIVLIRAFGTAGIILLHFILAIGPLARFDRRWLPVLYNRRHLGVAMFLLGFIHALIAILTYHVGGETNPFESILTSDAGVTVGTFPFQGFGFIALLILFAMAATSHDFWLANLTAPVWKTLHMGVYFAYAALIIHVAFGVLQAEVSPVYVALTLAGFITIAGLHLAAGLRTCGIDARPTRSPEEDGFVEVCLVSDIPEDAAHGVSVKGERVAVVKWQGKISAVSGVCQHQNGPLAEGKFVFGCLTCPWHGYQYRPDNGCSPEPFTEKIPTFQVRVADGKVYLHPTPNEAGTFVEPALVS
jgi:nitrite reductase/ring-hydroxylating ferredoxin subunit/DMSO/TMAO reductase YedYZ heme-binding membrane subunit